MNLRKKLNYEETEYICKLEFKVFCDLFSSESRKEKHIFIPIWHIIALWHQ